MTKENIIPIAFICDENYVMPTGVAITSLIANKKLETNYDIHVFTDSISKKSEHILVNMSVEKVNITIHKIKNKFNNLGKNHVYVSKSAYIKFELQNLLSQYDKIIYIDSDTLITNDLSDLFDTDIDSAYAGVVEDMYANQVKKEHIKYNVDKFFNSGVMLLNTKKLREENMTEKLLATKTQLNDHYVDNGAFVVTFDKRIKSLSPIYNYMNPSANFTNSDYYHFYHDDKFKSPSLPPLPETLAIIHFTTEKPWNTACCFYWEEWIKYFKQSPFKRQKIKAKRFKFCRRERGKHLTLITILGIKFRIIK